MSLNYFKINLPGLVITSLTVLFGIGSAHSHAADSPALKGWPTASTTFHTGDLEFGSTHDWREAFNEAAQYWNDAPTPLTIDIVEDSGSGLCTSGGVNSTEFSDTICGSAWGENTLAVTVVYSDGDDLTKTDILFNDSVDWEIYDGNHRGSVTDFKRVASHELGHAVGLVHSEDIHSLMYPLVRNFAAPRLEDIDFLKSIYGGSPTISDVNIPDSKFFDCVYLRSQQRGWILPEEVIDLDCRSMQIEGLQGIEYFPELTNVDFYNNLISDADFGSNVKLDRILISDNNLIQLDLSKNNDLTEIYADNNELVQIDLKNLSLLETVYLQNNSLTSLDLSTAADHLDWLFAFNNQLSELDLSANIALTRVELSNNELVTVEFPDNSVINRLRLDGNKLTSLEFANISDIAILEISDNEFTSLDLSALDRLLVVSASNNLISEVTLNPNSPLGRLELADNQIESINLHEFDLYELNLSNNNISVFTPPIKNGRPNYPSDFLRLNGNSIEAIDFRDSRVSDYIDLSNNLLSEVYLPENAGKPSTLLLSNNKLVNLSIPRIGRLKSLSLNGNLLQDLDLGEQPSLETLDLSNNELSIVDLSGTSQIKTLSADGNLLTELDITPTFDALLNLSLLGNPLSSTSIDYLNSVNGNHGMFIQFDGRLNAKPYIAVSDHHEIITDSDQLPGESVFLQATVGDVDGSVDSVAWHLNSQLVSEDDSVNLDLEDGLNFVTFSVTDNEGAESVLDLEITVLTESQAAPIGRSEHFSTTNDSVRDLAISTIRELAFLASSHDVYLIDISDRSTPTELSSIGGCNVGEVCPIAPQAIGISNWGDYLYVLGRFDGIPGLQIYDVSDALNPVLLSLYTGFTSYEFSGLSVSRDDEEMYVSALTEGVVILDISDKTNPQALHTIPSPTVATGTQYSSSDDVLHVIHGLGGPFQIFDVRDPANPVKTFEETVLSASQGFDTNIRTIADKEHRGMVFFADDDEMFRLMLYGSEPTLVTRFGDPATTSILDESNLVVAGRGDFLTSAEDNRFSLLDIRDLDNLFTDSTFEIYYNLINFHEPDCRHLGAIPSDNTIYVACRARSRVGSHDDALFLDVYDLDVLIGSARNEAPVADAGPDIVVNDDDEDGYEQVELDGSASSDSDGIIQSYAWYEGESLVATSRWHFPYSSPANPIVSITLAAGVHNLTLEVQDNKGSMRQDTFTVEVVSTVEVDDEPPEEEEEAPLVPTGRFEHFSADNASVRDLAISSARNLAFLAGHHAIHFIDISNRSAPIELNVLDGCILGEVCPMYPEAIRISASGEYLYVLGLFDSVRGLKIYDVSDPVNPVSISLYTEFTFSAFNGSASLSVSPDDNEIYIAALTDGVVILDISDKANPQVLHTIPSPTLATGTLYSSSGDFLYVIHGLGGPFQMFDVSDPSNPVKTFEETVLSATQGFDTSIWRIASTDQPGAVFFSDKDEMFRMVLDGHNPTLATRFGDPATAFFSYRSNLVLAGGGDFLAGTEDNQFSFLDIRDINNVFTDSTFEIAYNLVNFHEPDCNYLGTISSDNTLYLACRARSRVSSHDDALFLDIYDLDELVGNNRNEAPVADAGPDLIIIDQDRNGFEQVELNGSASSDSDGFIQSYAWYEDETLVGISRWSFPFSSPADSTVNVSLDTGVHSLTLEVVDNKGSMNLDTVTVEVKAPAPSSSSGGGSGGGGSSGGGSSGGGSSGGSGGGGSGSNTLTISGSRSEVGEIIDRDIIVESSGLLTGGSLAGDVENAGEIMDVVVLDTARVTGGKLGGTIDNQGKIFDVTLNEGTTLSGGLLGGSIINGGEIGDIELQNDTNITGGYINGSIFNQAENPLSRPLINSSILSGSKLSNVVIGADSIVDPNVELFAGVEFDSNDNIPAGIRLTDALPVIGSDTGNTVIDLQSDVVIDDAFQINNKVPNLLQGIENLPEVQTDAASVKQDNETGILSLETSKSTTSLLPIEVRQADSSAQAGTFITSDGNLSIITETGREIESLPVLGNPEELQTIASVDGLALTIDSRNSLQFESTDESTSPVTFFARPNPITTTANPEQSPGVELKPSEFLQGVNTAEYRFLDENGQLQSQNLSPIPLDWFEMKDAVIDIEGVESIGIDLDGVISVDYLGTNVRLMADYTVTRPIQTQVSDLATTIQFADDFNGDGVTDLIATYPDGSQQRLFVFP